MGGLQCLRSGLRCRIDLSGIKAARCARRAARPAPGMRPGGRSGRAGRQTTHAERRHSQPVHAEAVTDGRPPLRGQSPASTPRVKGA
jgi:hypothetical protein